MVKGREEGGNREGQKKRIKKRERNEEGWFVFVRGRERKGKMKKDSLFLQGKSGVLCCHRFFF